MQGLRSVGYGAGRCVERYDRMLFERAPAAALGPSGELVDPDAPAPIRIYERVDRHRLDRLQRPRQRQPLPAAVEPRRGHLHGRDRHRRRLPRDRSHLHDGREPRRLRRPVPRRRSHLRRRAAARPRPEAPPRLHVDAPPRQWRARGDSGAPAAPRRHEGSRRPWRRRHRSWIAWRRSRSSTTSSPTRRRRAGASATARDVATRLVPPHEHDRGRARRARSRSSGSIGERCTTHSTRRC